jgi:hypothetical protein
LSIVIQSRLKLSIRLNYAKLPPESAAATKNIVKPVDETEKNNDDDINNNNVVDNDMNDDPFADDDDPFGAMPDHVNFWFYNIFVLH